MTTLPEERKGLLTSAAFLSSNSSGVRPSPVKRGYVIRTSMLCDTVPPPTDPTAMQLPDPMDGVSEREVFNAHSAEPMCFACHQWMDPIGNAFGAFASDGSYDPTLAEDTSGQIVPGSNTPDIGTNDFASVDELLGFLADNATVQQCFTVQAARFALGRGIDAADACSMKGVSEAFAANQFSVRELLLDIAASPMFATRNPVVPGGTCR